METIEHIIETANDLIWNTPEVFPLMVLLLLSVGLFLTVRLGLVQFRRFWHGIKVTAGKYDDPNDPGDVSHFQALSAALSATVGIGNIAGVATAIHYGGPGTLFWIWLTGLLGMASKFTECTLAIKYRKIAPDGSASGGPMYYIDMALGGKWKYAAYFFAGCAVISSFGSGNSIQAFTMADSFRADFGIPTWITGLVSASLVFMVIVGGIKRIGQVASKLVPMMALLYVTAALLILIMDFRAVPGALLSIVEGAFTPQGGIGGFAGSTFIFTLTWGVKRGLFSNEAGQGSAPIAHAAAKTDQPVREGVVALLGPFIDTMVICVMTGLVIITQGVWTEKLPDEVTYTPKSAVTAIAKGAGVLPGSVIDEEDLYTGKAFVIGGVVQGVSLVRNHSVIDGAVLSMGGAPFEGAIVYDGGDPEAFLDGAGAVIPEANVSIEGACLQNGSPLTAWAFKKGLDPLFPHGNYLITIAVFLFALSTAISWSYYGDRAVQYLFGDKAILPYKVVFCVMHFLGAIFSLEVVWGFGDAALGLMAIPNLVAIVFLSGKVKKMERQYFDEMKNHP